MTHQQFVLRFDSCQLDVIHMFHTGSVCASYLWKCLFTRHSSSVQQSTVYTTLPKFQKMTNPKCKNLTDNVVS